MIHFPSLFWLYVNIWINLICDMDIFFSHASEITYNLTHSFVLIFVPCLFLMCIYFYQFGFLFCYQSFYISSKGNMGNEIFLSLKNHCFKNRQSYCDFWERWLYVMIWIDALSESLWHDPEAQGAAVEMWFVST